MADALARPVVASAVEQASLRGAAVERHWSGSAARPRPRRSGTSSSRARTGLAHIVPRGRGSSGSTRCSVAKTDIDQLSINTIRTLDGRRRPGCATPGHPGAPLGLAPAAYLLYTRIMKHNPADPHWPDRDRFVLSAGHASMLLYACLHLSGYDADARRPQAVPPARLAHAGPPRVRRHRRRRDDDGPARPGLRQRGRDGDGREVPARALRRRRPATTTSSPSAPTAT